MSKSKIPPKLRRAIREIGELVCEEIQLFGFHSVFAQARKIDVDYTVRLNLSPCAYADFFAVTAPLLRSSDLPGFGNRHRIRLPLTVCRIRGA